MCVGAVGAVGAPDLAIWTVRRFACDCGGSGCRMLTHLSLPFPRRIWLFIEEGPFFPLQFVSNNPKLFPIPPIIP